MSGLSSHRVVHVRAFPASFPSSTLMGRHRFGMDGPLPVCEGASAPQMICSPTACCPPPVRYTTRIHRSSSSSELPPAATGSSPTAAAASTGRESLPFPFYVGAPVVFSVNPTVSAAEPAVQQPPDRHSVCLSRCHLEPDPSPCRPYFPGSRLQSYY